MNDYTFYSVLVVDVVATLVFGFHKKLKIRSTALAVAVVALFVAVWYR